MWSVLLLVTGFDNRTFVTRGLGVNLFKIEEVEEGSLIFPIFPFLWVTVEKVPKCDRVKGYS